MISFRSYCNMKVCCVIEAILMSIHNIRFQDKLRHLEYPKYINICSYEKILGTQERIRNSRGIEPSVFEPSKFQCTKCKPFISQSHLLILY